MAPTRPPEAPVTLIDHAARPAGCGLAPRPTDARAIVLLKPSERDLIARYRSAGFHGYLIKPLRRGSLAERVLAASGAQQTMQPGPPPPPPEDDRVALTRFSGIRVLLVEDNPVGALLASTLLKREGCAVETAASGHEALDALKRARYDLVFMDMRMPGMDGPSAARAIRARGDETPIIALTANALGHHREAWEAVDAFAFLTKPIDPNLLVSTLLAAHETNRASRAPDAAAA